MKARELKSRNIGTSREIIRAIEQLRRDGQLPAHAADMATRAVTLYTNPVAALRATANWMNRTGMTPPAQFVDGSFATTARAAASG